MVTQERLFQLFSYCSDTGVFVRKIGVKGSAAGSVAGNLMLNGYIKITVDRRQYYAHRLAWLWTNGALPESEIDHINGNKADNRISNLRLSDPVTNGQNMKMPKSNKSGVKGVCWHKAANKWHAQLRYGGRQNNLGFYDSLEEAEQVIRKAREENHKEFARHS